MATSLRTPIGVLSFPVLFSPRPRSPGAEPVFQCSLLFDQTAQRDPAFAKLRQAVREAIDDAFGKGKSQDQAFLRTIRSPFRRCQEKAYKGYDIEGGLYISPWSKSKPGVVDPRLQEITTPDDVWPGQMARASVVVFPYNTSGNKGVSFALNNIQICRMDGERLDGRKAAKDDFDEYADGVAAMADADDDIPF